MRCDFKREIDLQKIKIRLVFQMKRQTTLHNCKSETAKYFSRHIPVLPYQEELLPKSRSSKGMSGRQKPTAADVTNVKAHKSHVSFDERFDDDVLRKLRQSRCVQEEIERRNKVLLQREEVVADMDRISIRAESDRKCVRRAPEVGATAAKEGAAKRKLFATESFKSMEIDDVFDETSGAGGVTWQASVSSDDDLFDDNIPHVYLPSSRASVPEIPVSGHAHDVTRASLPSIVRARRRSNLAQNSRASSVDDESPLETVEEAEVSPLELRQLLRRLRDDAAAASSSQLPRLSETDSSASLPEDAQPTPGAIPKSSEGRRAPVSRSGSKTDMTSQRRHSRRSSSQKRCSISGIKGIHKCIVHLDGCRFLIGKTTVTCNLSSLSLSAKT